MITRTKQKVGTCVQLIHFLILYLNVSTFYLFNSFNLPNRIILTKNHLMWTNSKKNSVDERFSRMS